MGPFDTILSPLYYVVSWLIITFHSMFSQVFPAGSGWAWGLSIVLLVLVVRAAMIPIFTKQIKSMRTMQALQPKMKVIQERHKNDRQRQSEEMMKLYKEAGTNPAASCLPMLIQIPIGAALYGVLRNVAQGHKVGVFTPDLLESARHADIFGAQISQTFYGSGGSTTVKVVTAIFIALMCVTQFMTTRQIMTKNVDLTVKTPYMQQQKMMMYFLPLIYVFTGPAMPVGVLIYMFTTNIWTMGQQLVIIRNNPTPGSIAWKERQARLKAAGKLNADGTEIKGLASLVKGGANPVEDAEPEPEPARQQPKRQTKAQRASGGGQQQRGKGQQGGGGTKTAPSRGRATTGGNRIQGGGQSSKKKS